MGSEILRHLPSSVMGGTVTQAVGPAANATLKGSRNAAR